MCLYKPKNLESDEKMNCKCCGNKLKFINDFVKKTIKCFNCKNHRWFFSNNDYVCKCLIIEEIKQLFICEYCSKPKCLVCKKKTKNEECNKQCTQFVCISCIIESCRIYSSIRLKLQDCGVIFLKELAYKYGLSRPHLYKKEFLVTMLLNVCTIDDLKDK